MDRRELSPVQPEEGLARALKTSVLKPEVEEVGVWEAYGRRLAEDVKVTVEIPPYHMAFFDGYAVRVESLKRAGRKPVKLRVAGSIQLEEKVLPVVKLGEAYKVCAGAPLPIGADCLIPFEKAVEKDGEIWVRERAKRGQYVVWKGKDFKRNAVALKAGRWLRSQDLALLFRLRMGRVKVYVKPRVALFSIGSELTDSLEEEEKTPASHGILFKGLVEASGGKAEYLGVIPDDLEEIASRLREALREFDILVTLGGSSVGERDLVSEAVNRLGKPGIIVEGLKVRPGAANRLGVVNGKPIVLIPGLIQSALVGFHYLLKPLILAKLGSLKEAPPIVKASLTRRIILRDSQGFRRVYFVRLSRGAEGFKAEPLMGESPLISPTVKASGCILPPRGKQVAEKGETVDVHVTPGLFPLGWS